MSPASRDLIHAAQKARLGVFVSPITAWEIATLLRKNRIQLNRPPEVWFDALLSLPGIRLAQLSPAVLIASALLPGAAPRDPADRIIAATSRCVRLHRDHAGWGTDSVCGRGSYPSRCLLDGRKTVRTFAIRHSISADIAAAQGGVSPPRL